MPLIPKITKGFQKDMKRATKRGKDTHKIKTVMQLLIGKQALNKKYKDHSLIGDYSGHRECHIEPDWLLIYKIDDEYISFERTGTHSDLFK